MTTEPIFESGMQFGPFKGGECFQIEKSACYQKLQSGMKIAEFLLLRGSEDRRQIWIVEAKSSSPRPENVESFNEYIAEIREKFVCAFLLGNAAIIGRQEELRAELHPDYLALDLQSLGYRFILVINGHKPEWLPPLRDAISKALQSLVKAWNLDPVSVLVLNDALARKKGLIHDIFA